MNLGPWAKALVGAAAAGVAPYTAATTATSQGGAHVTVGEWLTVAIAVLAASALVWRSDNVRWFPYAKATAAGAVVFLGALAPAMLSGETASVVLILTALFKTALAFGLVSQVPNASVSEWHDQIGSDGEDEPDGSSVTDEQGRAWVLPPAAEVTPVDADGDGHDDTTGHWMPKGTKVDPDGGVGVRPRLYLPPNRALGYLAGPAV